MITNTLNVLIVGYLRFDGILRNLEACSEAGIREVYLALDGGKNLDAIHKQNFGLEKILEFVDSNNMVLHVRRRNSNAGLAVGVIEGVTWFFEHVDFGVILEDDLETSQDFFRFVSEARVEFNSQEVSVISGNNYFKSGSGDRVGAANYPLVWGWATWRDCWDKYLTSIHGPLVPHFNPRCSLKVNAFWFTAALQSRLGVVDSWAMSFGQFIWMRDLICLLPPVNLVSNSGADSQASHSNENDEFIRHPIGALTWPLDWHLPDGLRIREINNHLEMFIFGITAKNLISPIKLALRMLLSGNRKSLSTRLRESATASDFLLIQRGL
jgi:hypothetical protein